MGRRDRRRSLKMKRRTAEKKYKERVKQRREKQPNEKA
jgi:hypothetical protein